MLVSSWSGRIFAVSGYRDTKSRTILCHAASRCITVHGDGVYLQFTWSLTAIPWHPHKGTVTETKDKLADSSTPPFNECILEGVEMGSKRVKTKIFRATLYESLYKWKRMWVGSVLLKPFAAACTLCASECVSLARGENDARWLRRVSCVKGRRVLWWLLAPAARVLLVGGGEKISRKADRDSLRTADAPMKFKTQHLLLEDNWDSETGLDPLLVWVCVREKEHVCACRQD